MKILTRYVIRAHVGPFLFAFTAVTGLLFLNAIAQRMETLAGRGLGVDVIGEFMMYSFPHVAALTFPMAVLVAVLYTFSDLTGQNEITAMAAGGIRPNRLLLPLMVVGVGLTGFMFWFNAQVLPESNHQLSTLLGDIGSSNPTLELREGVVNEVATGDGQRFFLEARQIDSGTSTLTDVVITDLSRMGEHRIIRADRGEMAFTPDRNDLFLTLYDGSAYETTDDRPGAFQRMDFGTQVLPMRGVGAELERRVGGGSTRGDREMTLAMLTAAVNDQLASLRELSRESRAASVQLVRATLGLPALDPGDAEADDGTTVAPSAGVAAVPTTGMLGDGGLEEALSVHRINQARWEVHVQSVYRYRVEYHKKFAIAFACLLFIVLGGPFAMRFPQGGVGMVIAASVGIFFLYWMGLIGGERLAERGYLEPWVAMWLPNMILAVPAVWLALAMGRRMPTTRGSSWDGLRYRVAGWFGRGEVA
jgi:lipopolysaccharide export system permease protein